MSCAKAAGTAQLAPSPRQVKRDATETTRRDLESEHPQPLVFVFSSPCSPTHCALTAQKYTAESLQCTEAFRRWKEESLLLNSASKPFTP